MKLVKMQGSNNKHKAQKAFTLVYKGMRSVEILCFPTANSAKRRQWTSTSKILEKNYSKHGIQRAKN